jgi:acyl-CoA reductase-like NAD-dependent aldehyde dehydrogenase
VLDNVGPELRAWKKEAFGQVISVATFESLDEAIDLANGTEYGLQAGIFTRDLSAALEAIHRLEFGGVTVNEAPQFRVDQMPYGGTKASGNTKEGPHDAVREMTEERMVVVKL